jgi:hypothetical protein
MRIKLALFFGLLAFSLNSCAQTRVPGSLRPFNARFAGEYSYRLGKGAIGNIILYPETDTTMLFYIEINNGAPSYNSGRLYGRACVLNEAGLFDVKFDDAEHGCKWNLAFSRGLLTIRSVFPNFDCGFGNAVIADGDYKRRSHKVIEYFEDGESAKTFFSKTSPEAYYKDRY